MVMNADDKTIRLKRFKDWIATVPRDVLERHLMDALWKGEIDKTEIVRCFEIERIGIKTGKKQDQPVQMIPRPVRSRERKAFVVWEDKCQH